MTSEELQAVRERVNKATPATWIADSDSVGAYVLCIEHGHYGSVALELSNDDAAFIAHAREDVPKLLDEIENRKWSYEALERKLVESRSQTSDRDREIERLRSAIHNAIKRLDWIDGYSSGHQEAIASASNLADHLNKVLAGEST